MPSDLLTKIFIPVKSNLSPIAYSVLYSLLESMEIPSIVTPEQAVSESTTILANTIKIKIRNIFLAI